MQHMHGHIPFMFDCWADLVRLLKSSKPVLKKHIVIPVDRFTGQPRRGARPSRPTSLPCTPATTARRPFTAPRSTPEILFHSVHPFRRRKVHIRDLLVNFYLPFRPCYRVPMVEQNLGVVVKQKFYNWHRAHSLRGVCRARIAWRVL